MMALIMGVALRLAFTIVAFFSTSTLAIGLEKSDVTSGGPAAMSDGSSQIITTTVDEAESLLEAADRDFLYDTFPDDFVWAAATAAYQVEGGWDEDGKTQSVWDAYASRPGRVHNGDTGKVACDSYHKYKEDIKLLKNLGVSHYRFSISWSRLLPGGSINQAGLDYYKSLLAELKSNNIKPIVTLYHWDLPQALERRGGWLSPDTVDEFRDFADICFREFGKDVDTWITLNDPWSIAHLGYGTGEIAPGKWGPGTNVYIAGHHLIKAHVAAYKLYDSTYRSKSPSSNGTIGIALRMDTHLPRDDGSAADEHAAERGNQFQFGWFASPIVGTGNYPDIMRKQVLKKSQKQGLAASRLPEFTDDEMTDNLGSADFLGINYYTSHLTSSAQLPHDASSYTNDMDINTAAADSWTLTGTDGVFSFPLGLSTALRWIKDTYKNTPVYITENGVSDRNASLNDAHRITFYRQHLNQVLKAIKQDHCDVRGFVAASLMDAFTGTQGYSEKFGIYSVNFDDPARPRTPKASASYMASVIRDNGFSTGYSGKGGQATGIVKLENPYEILYDQFPKTFAWSAASAAYTTEGAWDADGKGPSIWDTWAHAGNIAHDETGDVACGSYHKYKDDVKLLKNLEVTHYSFSLSWPRILPNGTASSLNEDGVNYYDSLINELKANNIQPIVTLYHWDLPQAIEDNGGWLNKDTPDLFEEFARVCFEKFGDRVKLWITMDGPAQAALQGYGQGTAPPGRVDLPQGQYLAGHQLILAHAKVYRLYQGSFKASQKGEVGISINMDWAEPRDPLNPRDISAAERSLSFTADWFLHPILGDGDYPEVMKNRIAQHNPVKAGTATKSRLPELTDGDKKIIAGSADFLGMKYFRTNYVTEAAPTLPIRGSDYVTDRGTADVDNTGDPVSSSATGLRKVTSWIKQRYDIPIYVTANGLSDRNDTKYDWQRVNYNRLHLNQLLKAIKLDGCDIRGYTAWSLLDCLAWGDGYEVKSGLYQVDRSKDTALTRTQKASAVWYRSLIRDGGFKHGYTNEGGWATAPETEDQFLYALAPPDFKFGIATSAYQIEGAWDADGKGEHVWDRFSHDGKNLNNDTGDIAGDSYNKLDEDLRTIKDLGVDHYRFSIMWTRLMPTGRAPINRIGIDYYHRLIDGLLKMGVTPMVTMYHWDYPQQLQDQGGWYNPDSVQWFVDYADLLFKEYGDKVQEWITINEPWVVSIMGYGTAQYAPGFKDIEQGVYNVTHHMILGHAKVYRLYQQKYAKTQKGRVGIVLNCEWYQPADPTLEEDIEASVRGLDFYFGWFANPIFINGDYPEVMKEYILKASLKEGLSESRLPTFTDEEKAFVQNSADFIGLNHYTSALLRPSPGGTGYFGHQHVVTSKDPSWPSSGSDWLFLNPPGFRKLLNWIWLKYNKPIVVTENGITDRNSTMDDHYRVYTFQSYIDEMLKAIVLDKVNVQAYTAWCLIDTFEWSSGMVEKFGIYHINFSDPDRPRTPKASARYLYELYRDRGFIKGAFTDPERVTKLPYQNSMYAGRFPRHFSFGVSSSTLSAKISDKACPVPGDALNLNGSMEAFTRDIVALKDIKAEHYFFTLSWRFLLPGGRSQAENQQAVDFYRTALSLLEEAGVTPAVSLHQWDFPCSLKNGWQDSESVEEFKAFAKLSFEQFGDKVKVWSTFHQPEQMPFYIPGFTVNDKRMYAVYRNMLLAHAHTYRLYEEHFKGDQQGEVGISLHPLLSEAADPFDPNHGDSEHRSNDFSFGLFADPVFRGGDYSDQVKTEAGDSLTPLTQEEKEKIKDSADFMGLTYYQTAKVGTDVGAPSQKTLNPDLYPSAEDANPRGLRSLLRFVRERYGKIPVYVAENGVWDAEGTAEDDFRSQFIRDHVDEVLKAVRVDGMDVRGYTYHSLVDDYVWQYRDNRRFGLVESNTVKGKHSSTAYAVIISDHGIMKGEKVADKPLNDHKHDHSDNDHDDSTDDHTNEAHGQTDKAEGSQGKIQSNQKSKAKVKCTKCSKSHAAPTLAGSLLFLSFCQVIAQLLRQ